LTAETIALPSEDSYLRDRAIARDPDAPLFPTRTGEPYTVDGFSKLFLRIRHAAGLQDFFAHLLRHTWPRTSCGRQGHPCSN
jgi:integrase